MELYHFVRGSLAWIVTVAMIWPINVPLAALAYKIRQGPTPIALKPKEFWLRALSCAFMIGLLALAIVAVDYLLANRVQIPAGPLHVIMLAVFVPMGMWIMVVFFALDDLMQAASLLVIYLCLPAIVLYLLNALAGAMFDQPFWQPLVDGVGEWLKQPE